MGLNLWAHLFQSGREMIVKQSSQSSIFSLPDNNIFLLIDEVLWRACAFPYYISWRRFICHSEKIIISKKLLVFSLWENVSGVSRVE